MSTAQADIHALTEGADLHAIVQDFGRRARAASREMARAETGTRNAALLSIAELVESGADALAEANARDMAAARENNLEAALLDRLELTAARIQAMADGLREVAQLPDPVGAITDLSYRPSGIQVGRMRVPLGVIGIIYESRPNVTVDAAALCLKSGNACILRGGSEAIHSNQAIATLVRQGLEAAGLPADAVQVLGTTDRTAVSELLRMPEYVDVIVPRGGPSLIERVAAESQIPVIKHLDGICHVYVDDRADPAKAVAIAVNAKTHRYGVCNAMETLLIHAGIAETVMPDLLSAYAEAGVELRGCERCRAMNGQFEPATDEDWDTEYLAPVLAVRIVDDMDAAIRHIAQHGSGHTESVVTEDYSRARRFLREVDSSSVMVNASTRFADGFEYGLGAEIGISTDKLHARGPVGLEGLTSQKYVVFGEGQIRE